MKIVEFHGFEKFVSIDLIEKIFSRFICVLKLWIKLKIAQIFIDFNLIIFHFSNCWTITHSLYIDKRGIIKYILCAII